MNHVTNFTVFLLLFLALYFGLSFSLEEDKITVYQFEKIDYFPEMPISEDNLVTEQGVALGRLLFYDPILSRDSTFSCVSCHLQENAFASNEQFDKGLDGELMRRNTMPLFNLAWYEGFFWDGRANAIETQVFHPVRDVKEMDLTWEEAEKRIRRSSFYPTYFYEAFGSFEIDSVKIANAIAQFERTMISANSKFDQVLRGESYLTTDEYEGFGLMNNQVKGNCLHCHVTDGNGLGTTGRFANNGLDTASYPYSFKDIGRMESSGKHEDAGVFKIPSLRNLAFTAPYMHDGRFQTLREVLDFYSSGIQPSFSIDNKMAFAHQGGIRLTEEEKDKILMFLATLSDSSFIIDPKYSNPFPLD